MLNPWQSDEQISDEQLYSTLFPTPIQPFSLIVTDQPKSAAIKEEITEQDLYMEPSRKNIHMHSEIQHQTSVCTCMMQSCNKLAQYISQVDQPVDIPALSQFECITMDFARMLAQSDEETMDVFQIIQFLSKITFESRDLKAIGYYATCKNLYWKKSLPHRMNIVELIEQKLKSLDYSMTYEEVDMKATINLMDDKPLPSKNPPFSNFNSSNSLVGFDDGNSSVWGQLNGNSSMATLHDSLDKKDVCLLLDKICYHVKNCKKVDADLMIEFKLLLSKLLVESDEWLWGIDEIEDALTLAAEQLLIEEFQICIEEIAKFLRNPPKLPEKQKRKKKAMSMLPSADFLMKKPSVKSSSRKLEWIKVHNASEIPVDSEPAGYDEEGHPLFIARIEHDGGLAVGKVSRFSLGIAIPTVSGEKILTGQPFEILANLNDTKWIKIGANSAIRRPSLTGSSEVPDNAISGGYTKDGKLLFIARAHIRQDMNLKRKGSGMSSLLQGFSKFTVGHDKKDEDKVKHVESLLPGRTDKETKGCTVTFKGKVYYSIQPFELLVMEM